MKFLLIETSWYFITYGTWRRSQGERTCYKQVPLQRPFHIWWSSVLESISLPFKGGFVAASVADLGRQITDVLTSCRHHCRKVDWTHSTWVGEEQIRGAGAAEPCAGFCPGEKPGETFICPSFPWAHGWVSVSFHSPC